MTSIEALVNRQLLRLAVRREESAAEKQAAAPTRSILRVITISRQTGSGGHTLARRLADDLDFEFIDRQILDYIVQNSGARDQLIESLDERTRSGVDLWVEGVLRGRYVDRPEYTHMLIKSVSALAEHGDAVILGRAGNVILRERGGLHVRVIAPREVRAANLVNYGGMTLREASRRVVESDDQRQRFYEENFGADIDDPLGYDLILNTGNISLAAAEQAIVETWKAEIQHT
ncbi:MAG: cytidylate kinase-like family protein [Candidatus Zixiibacteriota bacterium]